MVAFVCHFFEKKWRKKLPTGRFLAHIFARRLRVLCSHCTKWIKFWSSFFKSLRVWAEPIKNSVFFLLAFSFALTVSKEKAVYGLDFVTN
jgi:hypothetical protein